MKRYFPLILSLAIHFVGLTQSINVTQSQSVVDLIQNVFAGQGVNISNITYNGNAIQAQGIKKNVSYFDNNNNNAFPFSKGIVMTTGNSLVAKGPNNSASKWNNAGTSIYYDQDMQAIAYLPITNGGVVEFDFVPIGNTIEFKYFFGSEEYMEYANMSYNDVFGFFISGPGITGPYSSPFPGGSINIAVLPSPPASANTRVSVNNVNQYVNGSFYEDNQNSNDPLFNTMQYDGYTKTLTAKADVQCGQTYHIKLGIMNVSDQAYDSGVFLEGGSFSSDGVQVAVQTSDGGNSVIRNCTDGKIIFTRPENQSGSPMTINYSVGGNAVSGVDYSPLQNPITFQAGEDSVSLNLSPLSGNNPNPKDSVIITVKTVNQCGDTLISVGTIYILNRPPLSITDNNPTIYCTNDSVQIIVNAKGAGKEPFTYNWQNGETNDTIYVKTSLHGPFDYVVTATDACGFSIKDTVHINMQQTLLIDSLSTTISKACKNTGSLIAYTSGVSGTPTYTWMNSDSIIISNSFSVSHVGGGWYYFSIKDNVCEVSDSVFVNIKNAPMAIIIPDKTDGCNPTTFALTNGSVNTSTYQWDLGHGFISVNNQSTQTVTLTQSAQITLIATDINGECSDTTNLTLNIIHCGCTDKLAENYDSTAITDNGSCSYAYPSISFPNVFTPNGDNNNDLFTAIDLKSTDKIEYWILNRWGNQMYHFQLDKAGQLINIQELGLWNGKVNGNDASDGVYFLKYIIHSNNGKTVNGQTFFHLVR